MPNSKKFEIDLSLIDSLDYLLGDSNDILNISPLMIINNSELKEIIRHLIIEDKEMLEKMKYV